MVMETSGGAKKKATSELLQAVKDLKAQVKAATPPPLTPGSVLASTAPPTDRPLPGTASNLGLGPRAGGATTERSPLGGLEQPAMQAPKNLMEVVSPRPTTIGSEPATPFQNRGQSSIVPLVSPSDIPGFSPYALPNFPGQTRTPLPPPDTDRFGPENPLVRDPLNVGAGLRQSMTPGEMRDWERRVSDPSMTTEQVLKTLGVIGGTAAFPLAMIGGLSALPAVMGGGLGALGEYAFPASAAGGAAAQRLYSQLSPGLANPIQAGIGEAPTLSQEALQMLQTLGDETGARRAGGGRVGRAAKQAVTQPVTAVGQAANALPQLPALPDRLLAAPPGVQGIPALSTDAMEAVRQMQLLAQQLSASATPPVNPVAALNLGTLGQTAQQLTPLLNGAVAPLVASGGPPALSDDAMMAIQQIMGLVGRSPAAVPATTAAPVISAAQTALNSLGTGGTGMQLLKMLGALGLLGVGGIAAKTATGANPLGEAVSNLTGAFPEDLIGYSGNPLMPVRANPGLAPDAFRNFLDLVNATPERAQTLQYQAQREEERRAALLAAQEAARRAREINNPYLQGARTDLFTGTFPEQMGTLAQNPRPVIAPPSAVTPPPVDRTLPGEGNVPGSPITREEKPAAATGHIGEPTTTGTAVEQAKADAPVSTREVAASGGGGGYQPGSDYYMPAPGAGTDFTAGWSEDDAKAITRATVGREMSKAELNNWIGAFYTEHQQWPWDLGPFDGYNNLIDHLMALGESQRVAAQGSYGSTTDATGNAYQDRGVTPEFWVDAYYNRYNAPTYPVGWREQPWGMDRRQDLLPGQMPGRFDPYWQAQMNMGNYDEAYANLRRPWVNYQPPADISQNYIGTPASPGIANPVLNLPGYTPSAPNYIPTNGLPW